MMRMVYVLLPGWASMKPWNSRVLVYRRQELLLLCKLVALLLLQLIQLVEGTKISKAPNPLTNLSYECCYICLWYYNFRYDSSKSFAQNVELTDPILSRFDILCVVKVFFLYMCFSFLWSLITLTFFGYWHELHPLYGCRMWLTQWQMTCLLNLLSIVTSNHNLKVVKWMIVSPRMAFRDLAVLLIPRFVTVTVAAALKFMSLCLGSNAISSYVYTGSSPELAEEILNILEVVCISKTEWNRCKEVRNGLC